MIQSILYDPSIYLVPAIVAHMNDRSFVRARDEEPQLAGVTFFDSFSREEPKGVFAVVDGRGRKDDRNWRVACSISFYELSAQQGAVPGVEVTAAIERSRPSVAMQHIKDFAQEIVDGINEGLDGFSLKINSMPETIDYDWSAGDDDTDLVNSVSWVWECRWSRIKAALPPDMVEPWDDGT